VEKNQSEVPVSNFSNILNLPELTVTILTMAQHNKLGLSFGGILLRNTEISRYFSKMAMGITYNSDFHSPRKTHKSVDIVLLIW